MFFKIFHSLVKWLVPFAAVSVQRQVYWPHYLRNSIFRFYTGTTAGISTHSIPADLEKTPVRKMKRVFIGDGNMLSIVVTDLPDTLIFSDSPGSGSEAMLLLPAMNGYYDSTMSHFVKSKFIFRQGKN